MVQLNWANISITWIGSRCTWGHIQCLDFIVMGEFIMSSLDVGWQFLFVPIAYHLPDCVASLSMVLCLWCLRTFLSYFSIRIRLFLCFVQCLLDTFIVSHCQQIHGCGDCCARVLSSPTWYFLSLVVFNDAKCCVTSGVANGQSATLLPPDAWSLKYWALLIYIE